MFDNIVLNLNKFVLAFVWLLLPKKKMICILECSISITANKFSSTFMAVFREHCLNEVLKIPVMKRILCMIVRASENSGKDDYNYNYKCDKCQDRGEMQECDSRSHSFLTFIQHLQHLTAFLKHFAINNLLNQNLKAGLILLFIRNKNKIS